MGIKKLFLDFRSFYKKAPKKIQIYFIIYSLISSILYFVLCFLPFFLGKIIDNIELGIKEREHIIGYIIISITTVIIFRLFNNVNIKVFNKTNKYILKKYILNQIDKEDNNPNKYINSFDEATNIFSDFIVTLPSYIIIILSLIVISIVMNYFVGLVFLGTIILLSIVLLLNDKIPAKKYSIYQKEKKNYYGKTTNLIENKLSLYSIDKSIINNRIDKDEISYYKTKRASVLTNEFLTHIINILSIVFTLSLLSLSLYLVSIEKITIGSFITISAFFDTALVQVKYLFSNYLDAKKIILDAKEINMDFEKYNLKDQVDYTSDVFELNNLEVGYMDKSLFKINLTIKKGEILIFKGKNGKGKTTLFNTLMGNQEKLSGEIKKNKNYKYVYISNLDHCFDFDTAKNNIILFNQKVEDTFDKKIKQQLNFLDTEGINLSGGEKERVVIIRKILREFDVILFDEPLKENDLQNKKIIWEYLIANRGNKTILLITHSKFFDKYASRIINIDEL